MKSAAASVCSGIGFSRQELKEKFFYQRPQFGDVRGGLILGMILMSQSVAHAGLCNLSGQDLINGPYSCMLPPIIYAFLGTSKHGSVGTGSLVALLVGQFITQASGG